VFSCGKSLKQDRTQHLFLLKIFIPLYGDKIFFTFNGTAHEKVKNSGPSKIPLCGEGAGFGLPKGNGSRYRAQGKTIKENVFSPYAVSLVPQTSAAGKTTKL
jgi:hypothetical protein